MVERKDYFAQKYPKLQQNKVVMSALKKVETSLEIQKKISKFLENNSHLESFEFIDAVLHYFHLNTLVGERDIQNIPTTGKVVIIANHPLGSLDALLLIQLVSRVRKDIKIVANDYLDSFVPLKPLLLNISQQDRAQRKEAIKAVYSSLKENGAVLVFPSDETSRATSSGIKDKVWQKSFLKFALRTNAPILPVYIDAKNSKTYYSIAALDKDLAQKMLAKEMFRHKDKSIRVMIGEMILNKNIMPEGMKKEKVVKLFKKHLYGLKSSKAYFKTKKVFQKKHSELNMYIKMQEIIEKRK